uniref:Uncharacterized protein n=1 Tax=Oryza meridionalis TaxID=40149 RepID=A0A0E0DDH0_9ORYZ
MWIVAVDGEPFFDSTSGRNDGRGGWLRRCCCPCRSAPHPLRPSNMWIEGGGASRPAVTAASPANRGGLPQHCLMRGADLEVPYRPPAAAMQSLLVPTAVAPAGNPMGGGVSFSVRASDVVAPAAGSDAAGDGGSRHAGGAALQALRRWLCFPISCKLLFSTTLIPSGLEPPSSTSETAGRRATLVVDVTAWMVPLVEYRVWLQGSSKSNEELQQKPGKGGLKAICSASWS